MRRELSGAIGFTGALLLLVATGTANAQVELSGNVLITNDYVFRGLSQTSEEPAVQGGIDLSGPSGLYVGTWGSNLNFGEDLSVGPRAHLELDLYGGIAPSAAGFDFDFGGIYYAYPGAASVRDYNYYELYAGVARALGPVTAGVNGAYSPDFFAASGAATYGGVDLSFGIPQSPVTLDGTVGYQYIELNDVFGTPDYLTWSAGASANVFGLGLGAAVTGTDLDEDDCFGGSDLCAPRFIISVGRDL